MVSCPSSGDVDTDKDGLINVEQFGQLLTGLAPVDVGEAVDMDCCARQGFA